MTVYRPGDTGFFSKNAFPEKYKPIIPSLGDLAPLPTLRLVDVPLHRRATNSARQLNPFSLLQYLLLITWGILPRRAVLSQLLPEFHLISPTSVASKALTRLCIIIDFEIPKVVYDRLVEPPAPIRDHLTRCVDNLYPSFPLNHKFSLSGITVEMLDPITTNLADAQAFLQSFITPSTILLGHSLESGLRELQFAHPWGIDPALIFRHPRGSPQAGAGVSDTQVV